MTTNIRTVSPVSCTCFFKARCAICHDVWTATSPSSAARLAQFIAGHISSFTMTNTSGADNKICARFCPASVPFYPQFRFENPQPAHNTLRSSPSVSKHHTRGLSPKLRNLRTRPWDLVRCTHNLYSKTRNLQTTSSHRLRDTALTISVQKSAICKQTTPRHPSRDTLHLAMDASRILEALMQYHIARASYDADRSATLTDDIPGGAENRPFSNVSGKHMATCFAYAASKALDPQEYCQLLSFLQKGPDILSPVPREELHKEIDNKVQEFYADETSISERDRRRLCAPSGKEDAELVIILHCQTRNGALPVGVFWDTTTFTFKLWQPKATAQTSYMATIGIGEQRRLL
jgi:hypothetical protein